MKLIQGAAMPFEHLNL